MLLMLFGGTFGGTRDLEHDPALAAALGHMVVAWSNAEESLVNVFEKMTGVPNLMATTAYYRIPTFEARTKVIRAMLRDWKTDTYDTEAITKTISKLASLAIVRNGWMHGCWAVQHGSGETFIFDYRADVGSADRCRPVKAADVMNHVRAVQRRALSLWDLVSSTARPPVRPPQPSGDQESRHRSYQDTKIDKPKPQPPPSRARAPKVSRKQRRQRALAQAKK